MAHQCVTGVFPTGTGHRVRLRRLTSLIGNQTKINEPPPEQAKDARSGRRGDAAKRILRKDLGRFAYRRRPHVAQVGRAAQ